MKITPINITAYQIEPPPSFSLDPIRVTLHDIGPGQGLINIECYGRAWASYWGAIGDRSIKDFFITCDSGYLVGNLHRGRITMREMEYLTRIIHAVQEALKTLPA